MKKDAKQELEYLVRSNEQCFVKRFHALALPHISNHMWPNSPPYFKYSCNLYKSYAFQDGCIYGEIQTGKNHRNIHVQVDDIRSIC